MKRKWLLISFVVMIIIILISSMSHKPIFDYFLDELSDIDTIVIELNDQHFVYEGNEAIRVMESLSQFHKLKATDVDSWSSEEEIGKIDFIKTDDVLYSMKLKAIPSMIAERNGYGSINNVNVYFEYENSYYTFITKTHLE